MDLTTCRNLPDPLYKGDRDKSLTPTISVDTIETYVRTFIGTLENLWCVRLLRALPVGLRVHRCGSLVGP